MNGADRHIGLKHGAGGRAMRELITGLFSKGMPRREGWVGLEAMDDGAALPVGERFLVVTTDSHVVHPILFPGGDIGRLAAAGTINDLAMMGAVEPLGLAVGVILEEGFSRGDLVRLWRSLRACCEEAGTTVVTGDTKVMGRGELDGIVINTTGFGFAGRVVSDAALEPGDRILVSGTLGDHGMAIMATRKELALDVSIESDVAPVHRLVARALDVGGSGVVAMKDPTRGGLSSALHEMAEKASVGIALDESRIPVRPEVRAVGELLGIDPLQVANEGKVVMGVRAGVADAVLDAVRSHPLGREASLIGVVTDTHLGRVVLDTGFGHRFLRELDGEPLPRIC